jgi:cell division septum initiation protein DivIVA
VSAGLSAERLAEIAGRVANAASGPWRTEVLANSGGAYVGVVAASGMCVLPPQDVDADDLEFITAAREDVPALLAEVGRLRARVAELEAQAATAESRGRALGHVAGLREAAEMVGNDDTCGCGGCDSCAQKAAAADVLAHADRMAAALDGITGGAS